MGPLELPLVLRWFWIACNGVCVIGLLPLGPLTKCVLYISRRGKLKLANASEKPPMLAVPAAWFTHFYVVGVVFNTALLAVMLLFASACTYPASTHAAQFSAIVAQFGGAGKVDSATGLGSSLSHLTKHYKYAWSTVLLLVMMEAQVLRRLYECIYVFHNNPLARMQVLTYIIGLMCYPAVSLTFFSSILPRSKLFGYVVCICCSGALAVVPVGWPRCLCLGLGPTYRCHVILGSLRRNKKQIGAASLHNHFSQDEGKTDSYSIPRGSWFELVSNAHYLAEIVVYFGLAIASGGTDLNIWLLFTWVVGNLSVVGQETHQWYLKKFEDYPRSRRAILPFIY